MINNQELIIDNNQNHNNNNNNNHSLNNNIYNDGKKNVELNNSADKQSILNQSQSQDIKQQQQLLSSPIQIREKYILRKENNKFSTLLPNELMPYFTSSEYHQLITSINKYKSPSQKFYFIMMLFETILFLVATGLGFYFLSTANNNKTSIALGLFLLVLSILTLIGCSITFFRKSKISIDEIGDFYKKINKKYESKQVRIIGVFKRNIYPNLGDSYYNIENNEILFEYPKLYNSQGVLLYNTGSSQYLAINSSDHNISNEKVPLLTPKPLFSQSSINNEKL